VILRTATLDDVPAIAELERSLFGADAWTRAAVVEEVGGPGRCAFVAVDGDRLVGYAVTMAVADVVDLQRIAVPPDSRRRGVAGALLAAATGRAREDGATRMLLEVGAANTGARAFYTAAGFTEIARRRRYYQDGSDALVLERPVDGAVGGTGDNG
jgi:ribosomal-protein-alanine acetyltransferase